MKQKKFYGNVTRDVTETAGVEVYAPDLSSAQDQILNLANDPPKTLDICWIRNDGSEGTVYYGDVDCDVVEVAPDTRFGHDCAECTLLGQYQEFDMYYCSKQGDGLHTVIARFGEDPAHYTSGPRQSSSNAVRVGWVMADSMGLTELVV